MRKLLFLSLFMSLSLGGTHSADAAGNRFKSKGKLKQRKAILARQKAAKAQKAEAKAFKRQQENAVERIMTKIGQSGNNKFDLTADSKKSVQQRKAVDGIMEKLKLSRGHVRSHKASGDPMVSSASRSNDSAVDEILRKIDTSPKKRLDTSTAQKELRELDVEAILRKMESREVPIEISDDVVSWNKSIFPATLEVSQWLNSKWPGNGTVEIRVNKTEVNKSLSTLKFLAQRRDMKIEAIGGNAPRDSYTNLINTEGKVYTMLNPSINARAAVVEHLKQNPKLGPVFFIVTNEKDTVIVKNTPKRTR